MSSITDHKKLRSQTNDENHKVKEQSPIREKTPLWNRRLRILCSQEPRLRDLVGLESIEGVVKIVQSLESIKGKLKERMSPIKNDEKRMEDCLNSSVPWVRTLRVLLSMEKKEDLTMGEVSLRRRQVILLEPTQRVRQRRLRLWRIVTQERRLDATMVSRQWSITILGDATK